MGILDQTRKETFSKFQIFKMDDKQKGIDNSKIQSKIKADEIDSSHEELSTETHNLETEPATLESNCSQEIKTVVSQSLVSEQTSDIETNKEAKSCDDHSGQSTDSE